MSKKVKGVIASLTGVKSEKVRQYLIKRLGKGKNQRYWYVISRSLMGNDTPWAEEMREWLRYDKEVGRVRALINTKLVKFVGLHKSEKWYRFRGILDKIFPLGVYLVGDLLLSTTGIQSEQKYRFIEEFNELCPAEALLCLAGDNSKEAHKIRVKYRGDKRLEWAYKKSLRGSP